MKTLLPFLAVCASAVSLIACTTVNSGQAAIEWTPSGGTLQEPLSEGSHLVSVFSTIIKYDLREQEHRESLSVLANNGLSIALEVSVLYKPIYNELYLLQTEVGPQYYEILVEPLIRSGARKVVGRYSPEEIYSSKREEVEREIFAEVTRKIESKHVLVDAILIRDVHLPKIVEEAIEQKLKQEQSALAMQFVLDKEIKESERKKIEAAGIADYQQIISKGLTEILLRWKEIEAFEKLSQSQNSKTIVVGSGKEMLPLIVNPETPGHSR